MLVDDGLINITDKVIDFFPDQLPKEQSDYLKAMTIDNLLTMTCGHETEAPIRVVSAEVDTVKI